MDDTTGRRWISSVFPSVFRNPRTDTRHARPMHRRLRFSCRCGRSPAAAVLFRTGFSCR